MTSDQHKRGRLKSAVKRSTRAADVALERVPRTYRISLFSASYSVAFAVVWFGGIAWAVITGPLNDDWTPATLGLVALALLLALLPAIVMTSIPYRISLTEEGQCEFRSILRERHVLVQDITAIDWDEEDIYIVRRGGKKVRLLADRAFKDFLVRLLELNPAIETDDDVRDTLGLQT